MEVSNGLDDLKAAIYACPNHIGIHSDHGYLDTCDNPLGPPYERSGLPSKNFLCIPMDMLQIGVLVLVGRLVEAKWCKLKYVPEYGW